MIEQEIHNRRMKRIKFDRFQFTMLIVVATLFVAAFAVLAYLYFEPTVFGR